MKQPALFIFADAIVILALLLVQVIVSNNMSTTGIELGEIQSKIDIYKKKNAILHEQVLTASSFTTIASEAGKLGFEDTKQSVVVTTDRSLARR